MLEKYPEQCSCEICVPQISTSLWYGYALFADAQRIAATSSHTFARSIFSAKNKFCLKKLSLRFHYAIFNVRFSVNTLKTRYHIKLNLQELYSSFVQTALLNEKLKIENGKLIFNFTFYIFRFPFDKYDKYLLILQNLRY